MYIRLKTWLWCLFFCYKSLIMYRRPVRTGVTIFYKNRYLHIHAYITVIGTWTLTVSDILYGMPSQLTPCLPFEINKQQWNDNPIIGCFVFFITQWCDIFPKWHSLLMILNVMLTHMLFKFAFIFEYSDNTRWLSILKTRFI